MFWDTLIYITGFVLIHIFSKNMKFLDGVPRSRFVSAAGGISVAYVFLHLLPQLSHFQQELEGEIDGGAWTIIESHIFIVAMLGFAIFYGLEVMVKKSRKKRGKEAVIAGAEVFWVHIGIFTLYNALIGYLLVQENFDGKLGTFFYFVAMGLHFVTNDKSLRRLHQHEYDKYGRWLLTAAVVIGWMAGISTEVGGAVVSILVALLAGGLILNVMKEELPDERDSSFQSFGIGMILYSLILLLF